MKLGILRESVMINDPRVAITPAIAKKIINKYPTTELKIQPSSLRAFSEEEYFAEGITVSENLSDCDYIFGIKEIDPSLLIATKPYLFFAHVAKQQSAQKNYFKKLVEKKISLIDYEYLTNSKGKRLCSFGYWAGVIGAYNTFRAIGIRYNLYTLPLSNTLSHLDELMQLLRNIPLPKLTFLISGDGLSARGVKDILIQLGIKEILPDQLTVKHKDAVFCQLTSGEYITHKKGQAFTKEDYYKHPANYSSSFLSLAEKADVYFACHYWSKQFPKYLQHADYLSEKFSLKIIADISCDVKGPIASTLRESTPEKHLYDYNPISKKEEP
ncbi:MAG: hypothetical protein PF541_18765, partial [Prolixibacteraceae bacterium]|nr:hypothetical protein [Prolixibacteraceae bacterium]